MGWHPEETVSLQLPLETKEVLCLDLEGAIRALAGLDRDTDRRSDSPSHPGPRSGLTPGLRRGQLRRRQQTRLAATSNAQAALDLHEREKQLRILERRSETAKAQFFLAASKTSQEVRVTPSAGDLPARRQRTLKGSGSLGCVPRSHGRRSQAEARRHFLARVVMGQPTASHFRRPSNSFSSISREPCNRGSLRDPHGAMAFLEEAAATKAEKRHTAKELLSKAPETPPSRHHACTQPCWHGQKK